MYQAAKLPHSVWHSPPNFKKSALDLSTGKGKSSLMKFLLWRCTLPLVLDSSSSWAHPPLGYFKAVLMFYDSIPSFLLEKKKESQPRHSTSNFANSWCVIWKSIFYCEGGGYSRNKKLFLLDQYQFPEGLLPYTPAHPSFTTHVYTHGSGRAQQWHFLQNYKIYSRETKGRSWGISTSKSWHEIISEMWLWIYLLSLEVSVDLPQLQMCMYTHVHTPIWINININIHVILILMLI